MNFTLYEEEIDILSDIAQSVFSPNEVVQQMENGPIHLNQIEQGQTIQGLFESLEMENVLTEIGQMVDNQMIQIDGMECGEKQDFQMDHEKKSQVNDAQKTNDEINYKRWSEEEDVALLHLSDLYKIKNRNGTDWNGILRDYSHVFVNDHRIKSKLTDRLRKLKKDSCPKLREKANKLQI